MAKFIAMSKLSPLRRIKNTPGTFMLIKQVGSINIYQKGGVHLNVLKD
jgi:hypothetical protein